MLRAQGDNFQDWISRINDVIHVDFVKETAGSNGIPKAVAEENRLAALEEYPLIICKAILEEEQADIRNGNCDYSGQSWKGYKLTEPPAQSKRHDTTGPSASRATSSSSSSGSACRRAVSSSADRPPDEENSAADTASLRSDNIPSLTSPQVIEIEKSKTRESGQEEDDIVLRTIFTRVEDHTTTSRRGKETNPGNGGTTMGGPETTSTTATTESDIFHPKDGSMDDLHAVPVQPFLLCYRSSRPGRSTFWASNCTG